MISDFIKQLLQDDVMRFSLCICVLAFLLGFFLGLAFNPDDKSTGKEKKK